MRKPNLFHRFTVFHAVALALSAALVTGCNAPVSQAPIPTVERSSDSALGADGFLYRMVEGKHWQRMGEVGWGQPIYSRRNVISGPTQFEVIGRLGDESVAPPVRRATASELIDAAQSNVIPDWFTPEERAAVAKLRL